MRSLYACPIDHWMESDVELNFKKFEIFWNKTIYLVENLDKHVFDKNFIHKFKKVH